MATRKPILSTIKPRTRIVYFRISEEEFTKFCGLCEAQGVRSLSELARLAVRSMLQSGTMSDVSDRLGGLERSILELNHQLKALPQLALPQLQESKSNAICDGDL
jgi:hypothetical protein